MSGTLRCTDALVDKYIVQMSSKRLKRFFCTESKMSHLSM